MSSSSFPSIVTGHPGAQLAIFISLALLVNFVYKSLNGPLVKIPGPWYTKWTDVVLKYHMLGGDKPKYVHDLHGKYGPIVRLAPGEISVAARSATAQMYRVKGEYLKSRWYRLLTPDMESVFSTIDVNFHRRHRRLLAAEMSESRLLAHEPVIDAKVRLLLQRLEEEMAGRGCVDVFRWCTCLATDVIGELSFGEGFRMLETGEKNQYLQDLQDVAQISGVLTIFPTLYALTKYIPLPIINKTRLQRERMKKYAEQSLQRHYRLAAVADNNDDEDAASNQSTLLSKLYRAKDDESLSFEELRDNAVSYIVAGSDTTANSLTYLLWSVCRRPDVREKLVRELRDRLGDDGAGDFGERELRELPYLNQVIEETLRLFAAVPAGLPRIVPDEGAVLVGHAVPGGVTVSAQSYSMHNDPAVFPDPLEFEPSRWENPTKEMKESIVTFGGGSRVCIGLHLARMELRLAAARFFLTYPSAKISTKESFTDKDMVPKMYFLMFPGGHRCLIELY